MKRYMLSIYNFTERVGRIVGVISAILLMILTSIILWGVFTRFVFNSPSAWTDMYAIYTLIALVFIGTAYTMQKEQHVGVDIILNRLTYKQKSMVQIITLTLALIYIIYLTYLTGAMAYESFLTNKKDIGLVRTPLYIPQTFMPIGSVFLSVSILGKIIKQICVYNDWIKVEENDPLLHQ